LAFSAKKYAATDEHWPDGGAACFKRKALAADGIGGHRDAPWLAIRSQATLVCPEQATAQAGRSCDAIERVAESSRTSGGIISLGPVVLAFFKGCNDGVEFLDILASSGFEYCGYIDLIAKLTRARAKFPEVAYRARASFFAPDNLLIEDRHPTPPHL
jgi:hypothetical protein